MADQKCGEGLAGRPVGAEISVVLPARIFAAAVMSTGAKPTGAAAYPRRQTTLISAPTGSGKTLAHF